MGDGDVQGASEALFDAAATMPDPWWKRRMLGIDVETTREHWEAGAGPDVNEERLVSVAVALVGGGADTWSHTWLVNPGFSIPPESTAIHGIHDEDVAGVPGIEAVLPDVWDVLSTAIEDRMAVVAYNAAYDLTVVDRESRRLVGYEALPGLPRAWQEIRVVDPMVVDRMIDKYRKGSRKLPNTCTIWEARAKRAGLIPADRPGILERERGGPHEAAADAIAACRLAWLIATKGEVQQTWPEGEVRALRAEWERCRHDLEALYDWQRRWRYQDQEALRDKWRLEGNPRWEGVRPEWPVYPEGVKVG